jgi:DNA-binding response OmpR family regulator
VVLLADHQVDGVHGLQRGADAWIAKPFGCHALLARPAMLLRRTQSTGQLSGATGCLELAGAELAASRTQAEDHMPAEGVP